MEDKLTRASFRPPEMTTCPRPQGLALPSVRAGAAGGRFSGTHSTGQVPSVPLMAGLDPPCFHRKAPTLEKPSPHQARVRRELRASARPTRQCCAGPASDPKLAELALSLRASLSDFKQHPQLSLKTLALSLPLCSRLAEPRSQGAVASCLVKRQPGAGWAGSQGALPRQGPWWAVPAPLSPAEG